jgi:RNA polymerase sigma-70 factor (ECF subfamily)
VVRSTSFIAGDLDLAREIAQEAMTRTFEAWDRMESDEHALRFTLRIASNLVKSRWRQERRINLAGLRVGQETVGVELPSNEDRIVLEAALRTLSGRQRACLALVDYIGLDVADAGEVMQMPAATIRVHLTRGRRRLARSLQPFYRPLESDA